MGINLPYDGKPGPLTLGPESSVEDLQALADIVADHIGLTKVTNKTCRVSYGGGAHQSEWPTVELKDTQNGRARYKTGKITFPKFALKKGRAFLVQYMVHEVCHFHLSTRGHDSAFKKLERQTLKELFNLGIEYSKAYVARLYDLTSGETLYSKAEQYRKAFGNPKQFEIGQPVEIEGHPEINATVARRNKKTVTVQIHRDWGTYKTKVYAKNLTPVETSLQTAAGSSKDTE